jgi:predicted dehydrogenase
MVGLAHDQRVVLRCGFNLRHHPVVDQIKQWTDRGEAGDFFCLRGRYGIGGRPGYDSEWRADAHAS